MSLHAKLAAVKIASGILKHEESELAQAWSEFSREFSAERRRRRIPKSVFAGKLGVTGQMLAYLERGKRAWTVKRAELAIKLLTRREQWPN